MPYSDIEKKRERDRLNFNKRYSNDKKFVEREAARKSEWYLQKRSTRGIRKERFDKLLQEIDAIVVKLELVPEKDRKKQLPDIKRMRDAARLIKVVAYHVTAANPAKAKPRKKKKLR